MTETEKIHLQALHSAREFKKSECNLIESIQKVDSRKVYQQKNYKSLFEYCVKALKLSESNTYSCINIARKSVKAPELLEAVKSGELTVSHARIISSVITKEDPEDWINEAMNLSVRELEREVVKVNPKNTSVGERIRPVAEDLSNLDCLLDKELEGLIRQAQDLLSQKRQKATNIRETLRQSLKDFIKINNPLENILKDSSREEFIPLNRPLTPRRKKQSLQRDKAQCQAKDPQGNLCGQRRWLDIHHILPLSMGGSHEMDNLITLCQGHHKLMHLGTNKYNTAQGKSQRGR